MTRTQRLTLFTAVFLALALLLQGAGGLVRAREPDRLARWRLGAFGTSGLGLFVLALGEGLQFIVLALAVSAELPWAAAVGATAGSLAVIAPAALIGERGWTALPLLAIRRTAGAMLGFSALRLL